MTYKIQIDDLVRDATAEEAAAIEAREAEVAAREADIEAKANAKVALLKKLGITEEEATLLLS
jgi:hypothetical protein